MKLLKYILLIISAVVLLAGCGGKRPAKQPEQTQKTCHFTGKMKNGAEKKTFNSKTDAHTWCLSNRTLFITQLKKNQTNTASTNEHAGNRNIQTVGYRIINIKHLNDNEYCNWMIKNRSTCKDL